MAPSAGGVRSFLLHRREPASVGSRRLEWLLRQWVRLCFFRKREAHTLPPASQPVQCTRRCYDYCGFIEGIRRGTISLVDASVNAVSSFSASGLVLRDGSEVRADSVIFATGYKTIGGDDTTDLHYEARRLGPTSAPPRLYLSLLSPALHGARAGRHCKVLGREGVWGEGRACSSYAPFNRSSARRCR